MEYTHILSKARIFNNMYASMGYIVPFLGFTDLQVRESAKIEMVGNWAFFDRISQIILQNNAEIRHYLKKIRSSRIQCYRSSNQECLILIGLRLSISNYFHIDCVYRSTPSIPDYWANMYFKINFDH
jgi:hypothetical protein